jgi:hypothetical protein
MDRKRPPPLLQAMHFGIAPGFVTILLELNAAQPEHDLH